MLPAGFIYLAMAIGLYGAVGYVRATWRDEVSPNRVTWVLWGVEGIMSFVVEVQQHVGTSSLMTLTLGLIPIAVVGASFKNPHSAWKLGGFDIFCGLLSLAGMIFWAFINQPTVALLSFVVADHVAALPTVRKSWLEPERESSRAFFMGSLNCTITVLTLKTVTTAGFAFPGTIMIMNFFIGLLIVTKAGPRFRQRYRASVK